MNLGQALEIHFNNLYFATPFDKEELDELKRRFYRLYEMGVINLDKRWYMNEISPIEFLNYLLIDIVNNIVRQDPLCALTDEQIERLEYNGNYRDIAQMCLNILDLRRYGVE